MEHHNENAISIDLIEQGDWDFLVLQEQSQIPTIAFYRDSSMYPAARLLAQRYAQFSDGEVIFFMTWGREFGGQQFYGDYSSPEFSDFYEMQAALAHAYYQIAGELGADVAAVGNAWGEALSQNPDVDLWSADHSHPTIEGSYLAACVFFTAFFNASPEGLSFHGGLFPALAGFYQQVVGEMFSSVSENAPGKRDRIELKVWPSCIGPGKDQMILDFSLPAQSNVNIDLVGIDGRVVDLIRLSRLEGGHHQMRLPFPVTHAGVYYCRLSSRNGFSSSRVLRVR